MGKRTKVLLVSGLIISLSCLGIWDWRDSAPVAAVDYWAWRPNVHLARVLPDAGTLYLLEGELLQRGDSIRFQRRGFPPSVASAHPIVMVYRLEVMQWPDSLQRQIRQDIEAFAARGNRVWGIQLDFDAATARLGSYGALLRQVRAALPPQYRLSVTGLMDWASQGRLEDLNALEGVVSEVVFQTYQGASPIQGHRRYLQRLSQRKLTVPFKIGLIEHGDYDADALAAVSRHPYYRGTVVFLLPERRVQ
ncbi:DUF3142 domain-containing protein [Candidatus Methylospira mobilis]|uniref:DUF3142 domain-containing protein n=1 Tax=Candidatus Methylospira mobilis TaxID=1808979 RepID=A0A5Q0BI82_9GAMM|nr:DUF3142 domain-containing protein [Candidatus Methylospira mobilis]QFY43595.1 DUF3142 domain-containing protein [Candidatus Methylospira mobilis]WNV04584.1 DUF3142 domain-containing protein [Candidatus Methylospira mobilis]